MNLLIRFTIVDLKIKAGQKDLQSDRTVDYSFICIYLFIYYIWNMRRIKEGSWGGGGGSGGGG